MSWRLRLRRRAAGNLIGQATALYGQGIVHEAAGTTSGRGGQS